MLLGELDIGVGVINSKLGSVGKGASGLMSGFAKLGVAAAVITGALAACAGVAAGLGDVLNFSGKLNDLSLATGESASNLTVLGQAFENAGLGSEAAGDFVLKLQDSIAGVNAESGAAAAALASMGLSANGLRAQNSLQQIESLQAGFAKLDQTAKVAAARDIFGKSGGKALALMNDPGAVSQAKEQAGPLASTMDANRESFDRLGDALNGVALSGKEFFAGFLEPLAPFFSDAAESLSDLDFTAVGRALGNIVMGFINFERAMISLYQKIASFVNNLSGGIIGKIFGGIGKIAESIAGDPKKATEKTAIGKALGGDVSGASSQVSALQRIGGGGGFGGGSDPLLSESQKQTSLLQRIADKLPGSNSAGGNFMPVPV